MPPPPPIVKGKEKAFVEEKFFGSTTSQPETPRSVDFATQMAEQSVLLNTSMELSLQKIRQDFQGELQQLEQRQNEKEQILLQTVLQGNTILQQNMKAMCEDLAAKTALAPPMNTDVALSAQMTQVVSVLQKSFETKMLDLRKDNLDVFAKLAEAQMKTEEKISNSIEKNVDFEKKVLQHVGIFMDKVEGNLGEIRKENQEARQDLQKFVTEQLQAQQKNSESLKKRN